MAVIFGWAIGSYLLVVFGLAIWANRRVQDEEDFIVAGRRLPLALSSATLLATWFGAGTLLTSTDEVFRQGLHVTALEPYGAGLCLLVAGLFFARPLWEMRICTLSDFYRRKFGRKMEALSVWTSIPSFIGWIAVQLIALAELIELLFGIPALTALVGVAVIAMVYTLLGGMWSVTLTDGLQVSLVLIGVVILGMEVFGQIGGGDLVAGLKQVKSMTSAEDLVLIPHGTVEEFVSWLGVLAVGSLGNIASQDLTQRLFAARSSAVAQKACWIAGAAYILFGSIPVALGLAGKHVLPEELTDSIIPALAREFLSPALAVVFVLALMSVVFSTIDSAILAPASILARNALRYIMPAHISTLRLCQGSVVLITGASVIVALSGKRAYELLENAYAIGLVGFFAPLVIGLYWKRLRESSALVSMIVGLAIWSPSVVFTIEAPLSLIAVAAGFLAYIVHDRVLRMLAG